MFVWTCLQSAHSLEEGELTKVVLARKSDVAVQGTLEPLQLLATLQVCPALQLLSLN